MKDLYSYTFSLSDFVITKEDIFSAMGFKAEVPASIAKTLDAVWDESLSLLNPAAGFKIVPASIEGEIVTADGTALSVKRIISSALKGSRFAAIFVATAGSALEEKASLYGAAGETLKMYLVDLIASGGVEKAADCMQEKLRAAAEADHLFITNRYSPGYCGWDTAEQQKIFALLPERFCGVALTPSSMMNPVKSVSGIIGIGESVSFRAYGCALCDKTDCIRRVH
jgi:hypothetical protein